MSLRYLNSNLFRFQTKKKTKIKYYLNLYLKLEIKNLYISPDEMKTYQECVVIYYINLCR